MRLLRSSAPNFRSELARFCAAAAAPAEIRDAVASILADVRARGDAAIADYVRKFDKAELAPAQFRVSATELAGEPITAKDGKAYQVKGRIEYHKAGEVFNHMKTWNPPNHPGHAAAALEAEEVYSGAQKIC